MRSPVQTHCAAKNNGSVACLCDMCTCGRHHCPAQQHKPRGVPLNAVTTYTAEYPERRLAANRRVAPPRVGLPVIKFTGESSYAQSYKPNDGFRPERVSPEPRVAKTTKFTGTTTFQSDYIPKPLQTHSKKAKQPWKESPIKFDGTTVYADTYKEFNARRDPLALSPEANRNRKQRIKFEAVTTNMAEYRPHSVQAVEKHGPRREPMRSLPFEGTSTHASTYVEHPLPPRSQSVTETRSWSPARQGNFLTTNQRDYVPNQIAKRESCKPRRGDLHHHKFEGASTTHTDFRQHPPCPVMNLVVPSQSARPTAYWDKLHESQGGPHVYFNKEIGDFE